MNTNATPLWSVLARVGGCGGGSGDWMEGIKSSSLSLSQTGSSLLGKADEPSRGLISPVWLRQHAMFNVECDCIGLICSLHTRESNWWAWSYCQLKCWLHPLARPLWKDPIYKKKRKKRHQDSLYHYVQCAFINAATVAAAKIHDHGRRQCIMTWQRLGLSLCCHLLLSGSDACLESSSGVNASPRNSTVKMSHHLCRYSVPLRNY